MCFSFISRWTRAFLAHVFSWLAFVVTIFMGHEMATTKANQEPTHVQGILDERDPLRDRIKFFIWHSRWKRKIPAKRSARPVWQHCKENPLPLSPFPQKLFLPHIHEQQMLHSTIHEAVIKLSLALLWPNFFNALSTKNLPLKMKRYDWWIVLASNWQGNLHYFLHHPSKHFAPT